MKNNYLEKLLKFDPFDHNFQTKKIFINLLKQIYDHHKINSKKYSKFLSHIKSDNKKKSNLIDSYLTTEAFKNDTINSISDINILKKIQSSGTSSQKKSQIVLDKKNSLNQRIVLSKIISTILGKKRLPMIIIESKKFFFKKNIDINAKIAAVNGFSNFGKDHFFLLNDNKKIDKEGLKSFIQKYKYNHIFIFGFTFDVYKYLVTGLDKKIIKDYLKNATLLHGGGWKKLEEKKISNLIFRKKIKKNTKINKIYNYYGMVEQAGSIFLECQECNYLKNSIFSDVYVRNSKLELEKNNKKGIIQILSVLPTSYPGHNLLTSDEGKIIDCKCKGKCFEIIGRVKDSEIRGCSNI